LEWININYDSLINNIVIIDSSKKENIELNININNLTEKSIDLQYIKTINEINNKKNKTLSEYFFLCIISDILQNSYNDYKNLKYLCIDNFYVDTLNLNNLYIDRIF